MPARIGGRFASSALARMGGRLHHPPRTVARLYAVRIPLGGASATFRAFKARKAPVRGLQQMVRVGDYVALRTRMREDPARIRLYNVARDPFEAHDLSSRPEEQARLKALTAILDERRRP